MKFFSSFIKAKLSLILSFLLGFTFSFYPVIITAQNVLNPEEIIRKAEEDYHNGKVIEAAHQLEQALSIFQQQANPNQQNIAITATNLCRLQIELGREEKAIKTCDLAIDYYRKTNDLLGIQQSQLYQSYALQQMGFYPLACQKITSILNISQNCQDLDKSIISLISSNSIVTVEAWRSLGEILRVMGQLSVSQAVLETLSLQNTSFPKMSSEIFLSLGNTYTALGNLARARVTQTKYRYLPWEYESVKIPELVENSKYDQDSDCLELAKNRYYCEIKKYYDRAKLNYQKASQSSVIETQIKAKLNQIELLLLLSSASNLEEAKKLHNQLCNLLYQQSSHKPNSENPPLTQVRTYAKIKHIRQKHWLHSIDTENVNIDNVNDEIIDLLQEALEEARELENQDNHFLVSYVVGTLGSFYEYLYHQKLDKKSLKKSQDLTKEALHLLSSNTSPDALYLLQSYTSPYLAYQWQWQLARLETNTNQAINYYQSAIQTLETVRKNLLIINPDIQFSFRDNVEPLYLELIDLLLAQEDEKQWRESIYYKDSLQLAELANFLQCNPQDFLPSSQIKTLTATPSLAESLEKFKKQVDSLINQDPHSAIIYPMVLENQVTLLLLSKDKLVQKTAIAPSSEKAVTANQLNQKVEEIRRLLTPNSRQNFDFQQSSKQLYQWLIKPIEEDLNNSPYEIKTLVFVLDSSLQNLPMTSLYDGNQYLIEKYAVVHAPSLQILNTEASSSNQITALITGASNAPSFENLDPLPYVKEELEKIRKMLPQNISLINQKFSQDNIKEQISKNPFSLVHIATHGTFSSDPQKTYLLDWEKLISVKQLEQLLRHNFVTSYQPIDLLVLSACETAKGDRRAALGLAGMALRVGVRSTIASLWQVNDRSTAELMTYLYQNLQDPNLTKAEALRQAQLRFFVQHKSESFNDFERAYYWTPFVLVGNWL